jgi:hypothetical protein
MITQFYLNFYVEFPLLFISTMLSITNMLDINLKSNMVVIFVIEELCLLGYNAVVH